MSLKETGFCSSDNEYLLTGFKHKNNMVNVVLWKEPTDDGIINGGKESTSGAGRQSSHHHLRGRLEVRMLAV